ncbi:hypothetical protein ACIQNG_13190 [Streptomyces sp. NPDC091377]|uniref:Rv1733c family protein n=1 Tax=unclassified Streptomyces TaxID=2593676 RepID=UPI00382BE8E0
MRTRVRGWRWRRSPLRRRSDVIEAWLLLAVGLLLFLGAPLAGAATAWWAYGDARATVAVQHEQRHMVRAEVVGTPPDTLPAISGGTSVRVTVRWTDAGGVTRTAPALVPAGTKHGTGVDVWFDRAGRSVAPPADSGMVWQHSLTLGVCATGGSAALVLLGWSGVRRVSLSHRLAEWDRDWARTEPKWTRRWA